MLECLRVTHVLQSYLDGVVDEVTARRIAAHLDDCRRCGLRADTYTEIKNALGRHEPTPPPALTRLREFADTLAAGLGDPHDEVG
jgi:predicted anti-sigma-YlaC factor YlaD